jgi:putative tricarboxylic transport membrane protein
MNFLSAVALALAITFPARPVTIMAPANPGGGWDSTARLIQQVFTSQQIVTVPTEVVNRPGAGGTIGLAEFVTSSRNDPHTILVLGRVMLGAILSNHSAVTLSDTVPIARLLNEYEAIAVGVDSKYRTFGELLADFRKGPERVTWGGGSAGGTDHILVGMLAQAAGIAPDRVNYIAHSGGGEAAVAVMGGHVSAGVSGFGEWRPHVQAGRMRFLAVSSESKFAGNPTPTIRESGLDVVLSNWRSVAAPPGTTHEAREWWVSAFRRMRDSPAWQEILRQNHWTDSFLTGSELERFIAEETQRDADILNAIGLVPNSSRYPYVVGLGFIVSLAWLWLSERRKASAVISEPVDWRGPGLTIAVLLAYILLFERAGYLIATTALILLTARILNSRRWVRNMIAAGAVSASAYLVFEILLKKGLP